jgi:hypothetical protein
MALSFRNVFGLFGKARKYGARSRSLAAQRVFRPVLEGLEERAVPSATAPKVVHAAALSPSRSVEHNEAIKIEYQKELPGDPAHKADDKGEVKAQQQTESLDNSTDKNSPDNSGSQHQDPSSSDSNSLDLKDR